VFRRRVRVMLAVLTLAWCVLLARLAQVQIGSHDLFVLDRYTQAGGNRSIETLRGGIYGYWGTPLAYQAPSFDVAVHYSQLVPACREPWALEDVRGLLDEYAAVAGLPPPGAEDCRRLWLEARAESPGSAQDYVRRRLAGESQRALRAGAPSAGRPADWRPIVAALTDSTIEDLTARADDIVRKVEQMEASVRRRQMEREGKADIRISERYQWHVVCEDLKAEAAIVFRTEPERLPVVRVNRAVEPAVKVLERTTRRHTNSGLAAHVIGPMRALSPEMWASLLEDGRTWRAGQTFAGIGKLYRMDDHVGDFGIERAAEDRLRGTRGHVLNRLVFKYLSYERESEEVAPEPGQDVCLTLREDFQEAANNALAWAADRELNPQLDFSAGAFVLMDVSSGAVLAAATWPAYDLADYRTRYPELLAHPLHPLVFRPTQGALPTGSVFKIIAAIAALEEGAITPATTFDCRQREVFRAGAQSRPFTCTGYHRSIALLPAIQKSCNIYFYHVGLRAGGDAMARWATAFGLGRPTGVDLPFEARHSQVPVPRHTFGVINLSIGQGEMRCTPLQVAGMMAAVANGGTLHTPHFIDHFRTAAGERIPPDRPASVRIPLKPGTLDTVREGMRLVTLPGGTADGMGLEHYGVAGKTGTAEMGQGRPNHAWFAGYLPHDDPKVAFAIVSEGTSVHGGEGAGPILAHCLESIGDAIAEMP